MSPKQYSKCAYPDFPLVHAVLGGGCLEQTRGATQFAELEAELARYVAVKHCITVASGTMICPESGLRYRLDPDSRLRCLDLSEEAPLPANQALGKVSYGEFKVRGTAQTPEVECRAAS